MHYELKKIHRIYIDLQIILTFNFDLGLTETKQMQGVNVFFIELPKIEQQNISIKDMTSIERWAKYFRNAADESKQDLIQELTKYEEGIMDAQAVLNRISTNDAMWVQQKHYMGLSKEQVAQGTGLSLEEINKLR